MGTSSNLLPNVWLVWLKSLQQGCDVIGSNDCLRCSKIQNAKRGVGSKMSWTWLELTS